MTLRRPGTASALLAALVLSAGAARADTHAACTGFVDSVPAVISSPGTWCLRRDVSTAQTSGTAIAIASDDVTLACNAFKVGGLAAGPATDAVGIGSEARSRVIIRDCGVRGFRTGVRIHGGHDVRIERNRLDGNRERGVDMSVGNGLLRGNLVFDTGGRPGATSAAGIHSHGADLIDNLVAGVHALRPDYQFVDGMNAHGYGITVRGNRVRGLVVPIRNGSGSGIRVGGGGNRVTGNQVVSGVFHGVGISGDLDLRTICTGNTVGGFSYNQYLTCRDGGGNVTF